MSAFHGGLPMHISACHTNAGQGFHEQDMPLIGADLIVSAEATAGASGLLNDFVARLL